MDITAFVVSGRDKAKLYGSYATYRAQLSNRIHNLRKKLGISTKPRAKYSGKATITAGDIGRSTAFVHLLLLTSERAWAHAMSMREAHSAEKKGITGSARSHIISRLYKATVHANLLFRLVGDQTQSGCRDEDVLEARAYAASLAGAMHFEKQSWHPCLESYAEARIIYSALNMSTKNDIFKDLLFDPVDPSIRYGAYQLKMSRTVAVPTIARDFFPSSDSKLVSQVKKLYPDVLNEQPTKVKADLTDAGATPKTITWRSKTVDLEDAAIATALASVNIAGKKLSETLTSEIAAQAKDKAAAFDDVLISSQDAVDATKHAIEELLREGVSQGDKRIQSLQITRTAVIYDMVSWRIGRNRVLVGDRDGAVEANSWAKNSKWNQTLVNDEAVGRKLAYFREKVVLYDSTLQSLDSIRELPGVAADSAFLEELRSKYEYFSALKCLSIARSYALLSNPKNALALLTRASDKCNYSQSFITSTVVTSEFSPPNITVFPIQVQFLKALLDGEVQRHRALVEIANINEAKQKLDQATVAPPLVERLSEYSSQNVNLERLVSYPPELEPIPVKPLFFDAAWNYIGYPGRADEVSSGNGVDVVPIKNAEHAQQQKKGWFGFGR